MNKNVEIYCQGAAMAYHDVAAKLRDMISRAPVETKPFMEHMRPFADSCDKKAEEVFKEADRFESAVRQ